MIPALSLTNLAAYALQIAALVVVSGATLWAARVHSPRVRLGCLRAILVACLLLPLVAAVPPRAMSASPTGSMIDTVVGRGLSAAGSVFRVFANPPAGISATSERAPSASRTVAVRFMLAVVPVVLVAGVVLRLMWLGVGLVALARLRTGSPRAARLRSPSLFANYGEASPERAPIDHARRREARGTYTGPRRDSVGSRGFSPGTTDRTRSSADEVLERACELVGARAEFMTTQTATRPVTFGLRRPVVMLPGSFVSMDQSEQLAIAVHELLHVRRHDWLHTIGEELLRALFWFHPAVWWLLGQIDLGREQVVDQQVVALTERRQPYVNALVRLALVPAGPVLRPASLLLGRAHLLQRVSLLSREVRMSRWRLAVSVLLVAAVVVLGGRLAVQAFPLIGSAGLMAAPHGALASSNHPQQAEAAAQRSPIAVPMLQRVPPAPIAVEPGKDAVVVVAATVDTSGLVTGPVSLYADGSQAAGNDPATTDKVIDGRMLSPDITVRMHSALDAVRSWRFEPPARPVVAYVGFNFAGDISSINVVPPIRVGGNVRQPTRIKHVRAVYPEAAQARGTQGVVILELVIDANGVPVEATALRQIPGLTVPAIESALQWRFTPTVANGGAVPILMTVTVNFTLDSGSSGVVGGVPSGISGGVPGGVAGGVQGGVAGGVQGGIVGAVPSGTPSSWPQNALRVGGEIKPPTKIKDVRPIYPPVAEQARVQGVVIAEVLIGPDGSVQDARILRSIPLLDQAALDAVRQWRFTPTLLNGTPVPLIMTVTVNFTLDSGEQPQQAAQATRFSGLTRERMPDGTVREVSTTVPADGVYKAGPGVTLPRVIREVKPDYEATAYQDKVQGSVILEAVVAPDGSIDRAQVVKSLDPRLDQKAIEAAMKWKFVPGTHNGVAVPVAISLEMTFTMR